MQPASRGRCARRRHRSRGPVDARGIERGGPCDLTTRGPVLIWSVVWCAGRLERRDSQLPETQPTSALRISFIIRPTWCSVDSPHKAYIGNRIPTNASIRNQQTYTLIFLPLPIRPHHTCNCIPFRVALRARMICSQRKAHPKLSTHMPSRISAREDTTET